MNDSPAQGTATIEEALASARRLTPSNPKAAIRQAREIIRVEPSIAETYFILSAALRLTGDVAGANDAEQQGIRISKADPVLVRVAQYLATDQLSNAERLLGLFLNDTPHDPEALRLSARLATSRGKLARAQEFLRRSLHLAPSFDEAANDLRSLFRAQEQALAVPSSAADEPPVGTDEFDDALRRNEQLVAERPGNPDHWLSYGHVLRISGRAQESLDAYRRSVEINPAYGQGWWSLADLKTFKFAPDDIETMLQAVESSSPSKQQSSLIQFALGKAYRDQGDFAASFRHYESANKLKRSLVTYFANSVEDHVAKSKALFTPEFFESRKGSGLATREPIFIIGMPRAGSTLVEQILSSHSQVEGTEELFELILLTEFLADGHVAGMEAPPYLNKLTGLAPDEMSAMGASYIYSTRSKRQSKRPHFTDKMPSNWLHVGLIQMILPNAYIMDVRRDPMSCCFSNFRQNFASGKNFAYDLEDLGRYYSAYVELMAHYDQVLPGRIHRVNYERLTANPEEEIRKLLAYLDLPFEEACLRQHENPRAVKTSSSEQVRQPIYSSSSDEVRPYEPWLEPLRTALGDVVDFYPNVPERWAQA